MSGNIIIIVRKNHFQKDLMEKCWDSNPSNRPTITELEYKISEWTRCINKYYSINQSGIYRYRVSDIDNKLESDIFEFVKTNNALLQEQTNIPITQSHSQACYTSRRFAKSSECLECMI
ncbi:kinase-like domain-containing protein [Rhizophagus clarus]|uniref:Kinase-like domain-containing protein n=1 Tax=Rhizophagus clarus TaxID=94130 RepID=A0A8H3LTX9_9GLOM|nr:kinase-like domain-containing protein [Rhizophagus clarus]